jgi:HK97 family phage portal protein
MKWKFFRKAVNNPAVRSILVSLARQVQWTPKNYTALAQAGYESSAAVYACVSLISRAAAGIEWRVFRGDREAPSEHPLRRLLDRPDPWTGSRRFLTRHFGFLLIAGNSFWIKLGVAGRPPIELYILRPDRVSIKPSGMSAAPILNYQYTVSGNAESIEPAIVYHAKMFHPTNDFYGLSPLEVAARGVDITNFVNEWNARLLQNDMRPPGALTTDQALSDAQFERLKKMIGSDWGGYENAGKPLLLEGGLKFTPFSFGQKDADWTQVAKLTKREICSIFNVWPELIGDGEVKTFANSREARRALYTETVLPLMFELRDDLNTWLAPDFGPDIRLEIALERIEALQEDRASKFAYVASADWLSIDEKRATTGYGELGGATGGMILVPIGKIPLDIVGSKDPEEATGKAGKRPVDGRSPELRLPPTLPEVAPQKAGKREKSGFWTASVEVKRALWDNFVSRVEAKERSLIKPVKSFLDAETRRIAVEARRARNLGELHVAEIIDPKAEAKRYAKELFPLYAEIARLAGASGVANSKGELMTLERRDRIDFFNLSPELEESLRKMILFSGTKLSETTMALTRDILKTSEMASETVEQFTQRLIEKLDALSQFRCRLIARTETAKVENWGTLEGYRQTEFIERKGWLCAFVDESREEHKEADARYSDAPIPLGEAFVVGGKEMMYPGDPAGDAGNVCNCLCTLYPDVG